jgi:hypothetical protein
MYEFGLVHHGGENKLWAPNAFIESTPMKLFGRLWRGRCTIIRNGSRGRVGRYCRRGGRSVVRERHDGSEEINDRSPGASPQPGE